MEDNTYFYPNACHVCKRWDVNLMSCAKCQMVSYCNEEHQRQHWPQHEEICAAIKVVLGDKEYMNTEEISMGEWTEIRSEYVDKVSDKLQRYLKNEETEMLKFPKACVVCHRQDAIIRCNDCPNTSFCHKHKNESESEHREKYCKLYRECYEMDKYELAEYMDISYVNRLSNEEPFQNMKGFLDIYVPLDKNDVYLQMLHSGLVTNPLTAYFCIEQLGHLTYETLSIHIIGISVISDPDDLEVWKILFTLIPTLTTLTLTFIQTEKAFFSKCKTGVNISETKKFVANVRYMSYEEYIGTTEFEKPNYIVGLDAGVIDDSFSTDEYVDISAFIKHEYPCILVFDYLSQREEEMLHKIDKFFFGENPFLNLMPSRDFTAEGICYDNKHLIMFNNLGSSRVFIKENEYMLLPKAPPE